MHALAFLSGPNNLAATAVYRSSGGAGQADETGQEAHAGNTPNGRRHGTGNAGRTASTSKAGRTAQADKTAKNDSTGRQDCQAGSTGGTSRKHRTEFQGGQATQAKPR